jgi:hypothetical protein
MIGALDVRTTTTTAAALLMAASLLMISPAHAECSDEQILKFHKKGISAQKIADRCEMDIETVEEIIEAEKEVDPPSQAWCCDGYGNSRCPIVSGSTTIGSPCFCPGQGYGVICR